jgi:hypothetical protein
MLKLLPIALQLDADVMDSETAKLEWLRRVDTSLTALPSAR